MVVLIALAALLVIVPSIIALGLIFKIIAAGFAWILSPLWK